MRECHDRAFLLGSSIRKRIEIVNAQTTLYGPNEMQLLKAAQLHQKYCQLTEDYPLKPGVEDVYVGAAGIYLRSFSLVNEIDNRSRLLDQHVPSSVDLVVGLRPC